MVTAKAARKIMRRIVCPYSLYMHGD
jgi:hypothetical protein